MLSRGGSVVRLAGLYSLDRGPHTFWLKNGTVSSNADGLVNTLHYDDAARVAVATCLYGEIYLSYCRLTTVLLLPAEMSFYVLANLRSICIVSCLTSVYFFIILIPGVAGTAYLACDDEPVTREEICAAALASGRFPDLKMPQVRSLQKSQILFISLHRSKFYQITKISLLIDITACDSLSVQFASKTGPLGKITSGQRTREALQWSPLPDRKTFSTYMRSTIGGDENYETSKQKLARERQERTDVKNKAKGIAEGAAPASVTSSFLWIPGEDEDADNDIFQL